MIKGSSEDKPEFHMVHALPGHSDWVQGIDLCRDPALPNDWLLVSSSHDGLIRVYRLSPRTEEEASREQRSAEQMDEIKVQKLIILTPALISRKLIIFICRFGRRCSPFRAHSTL